MRLRVRRMWSLVVMAAACLGTLAGACAMAAPSLKESTSVLADLHMRVAHPKYPFPEVSCVQISRDGKHVAYIGRYDYAALYMGSFSGPGGAYGGVWEVMPARTTRRWVVDGKEHPEFDVVQDDTYVFSPNGLRTAYAAQLRPKRNASAGKWVIVTDGKTGSSYEAVRSPVFSPDSKHLAYAARDGEQWTVVADGRGGKKYQDVGTPVFGADAKRLAFAACRSGKWVVVIGKTESPEYDAIGTVVFSPDSQRLAFAAQRGDQWLVVCDNVEGPPGGDLHSLTFSPDSQRLAYAIRVDHAGKHASSAEQEWQVREGEAVTGLYRGVTRLVFSPDGQHLAFAAGTGDRSTLVVDGAAQGAYQECTAPIFAPDGGSVGFAARVQDQWVAIVRGAVSAPCEAIGRPVFSPDGQHFAYAVKRAGRHLVVVDGAAETEAYDRVFAPGLDPGDAGAEPYFDGQGMLHFAALRGSEVLSVGVTITTSPN